MRSIEVCVSFITGRRRHRGRRQRGRRRRRRPGHRRSTTRATLEHFENGQQNIMGLHKLIIDASIIIIKYNNVSIKNRIESQRIASYKTKKYLKIWVIFK